MRKGNSAGNQYFLLFPQYSLPIPKRFSVLSYIYFVAWKCFQFGPYKNSSFVRGLSFVKGYKIMHCFIKGLS